MELRELRYALRALSNMARLRMVQYLAGYDEEITVTHAGTSGEVELALLRDGDLALVTLASDHTDRTAEAFDIAVSKLVCPKVLARAALPLEHLRGRWEQLALLSWIEENGERVLYQSGRAAELIAPDELLTHIPFRRRPERLVLLGGTLPAHGPLRGSPRFWAELRDDGRGETLRLSYRVRVLDLLEEA